MCNLEKRGNLFILTLTGSDEHRLNPTLLDAIQSALHRVRSESSASSALITTAHGKFFSNGYDLDWAKSGGQDTKPRLQLMSSKLRSLVKDLISLPLPTIAAVTGHASAGGMILAVSHDYVVMRRDRGFLYMSELDIGLPIPAWFTAVIGAKIGSPAARRSVLLRSAKLAADAAAKWGIVESAHDGAEETVRAAVRLGEELVGRKWDGHVYGQIRMEMFSDLLRALDFDETVGDSKLLNNVASRL
ncbi:Enoyl-CoA delta isomerase 1, peroxisomal like [Actinidia chinensis var. chinensis]|uniref:Delta(3)-Delta(2)-enoyl-CoA isomerase n=1 Tax=Actinidia chinensis var. chinensis TaxID=1590841 RepID=A0A2R6RRF4_ACTCC|nr:Enoyl-CoA delta isomerase 1, peroxisomal like [Actinidia chinensis var. chinensis]